MTLPPMQRLGPVRMVFTDRRGGVSHSPWNTLNLADHVGDDARHVAQNRQRVADRLDVRQVSVVQAEHGNRVRYAVQAGDNEPGDALVTTMPGLGLLALAADCVAGVIAAPDINGVAVFHCGWRGVLVDTVGATVAALVDIGAAPGQMVARLGPGICPRCYPVGGDVRDQVAAVAPAGWATTASGEPSVDVIKAVTSQLARAGVRDVQRDLRCTAEDPDLFSYRRDGTTGRHGVLAVIGEAR